MSKTRAKEEIKTSSTAEYFSKNLQQVGFSSPTKAVLTTLKEAFDNSLDACEDHGILPSIDILIERVGKGSTKNTDQILVRVSDNGPGIPAKDLPKVFGEYLASSKFGRGRCTRGQQGIGISAATTWAMQTSAQGVLVTTKVVGQKKAVRCRIEIDLKHNKGIVRDKDEIDWAQPHGTIVEFLIDGRVQINGEAGLQAFLRSNVLVNPHLEINYKLLDEPEVRVERVSKDVPNIPEATPPHPHTMKLGEFLAHGKIFGNSTVKEWLQKAFSRISDQVIQDLIANQVVPKKTFERLLSEISEADFKQLFTGIQEASLQAPSTSSVLAIGEAGLAKSILRLGDIDYFSVVTRRPAICDFKPVQVEVAIARLISKGGSSEEDSDESVQVIRFANRVPLQFDKAGCAIVKALTTVNWKVYGLKQARSALPQGPYIMAVSVVSPFIKFKNASKETIDASDELVEEIRRALQQAGQKLSRYLRKEHKEAALESKMQHIEQFAPILVDGLVRLTNSDDKRKSAAHSGLLKILGRETHAAEIELEEAENRLEKHIASKRKRLGAAFDVIMARDQSDEELDSEEEDESYEEDEGAADGKGKSKAKGKKKNQEQGKGQKTTVKVKVKGKNKSKSKSKSKNQDDPIDVIEAGHPIEGADPKTRGNAKRAVAAAKAKSSEKKASEAPEGLKKAKPAAKSKSKKGKGADKKIKSPVSEPAAAKKAAVVPTSKAPAATKTKSKAKSKVKRK